MPVKVGVTREALYTGRSTELPLELAHWYTAEASGNTIVGKRNPAGKTYVASVSDSDTEVLAVAGLYRAYYQSASDASLVYEQMTTPTSTAGSHDPYALYSVQVWVEFPAASEVTVTTAPAIGSEGYWKDDSTIKWRDSAGVDWTESEIISKLDPTGVDNAESARFKVGRKANTDRAMFFGASNAGTVSTHPSAGSDSDTEFTIAVRLEGIGNSSSKVTIGSFGLYVEGVRASETYSTAEDETITANFTITVEKPA